ncbi:MAG: DEAD/DEAH box helicase family protein [Burkholderiaceae bacterium]|nr:DEAD/DEAH box helicase family protein [Burkholderiaceae bacterium]
MTAPASLIINNAFTEPAQHWVENPDRTLRLEPTRRPAGYEIIDTRENTRRLVALPQVDAIRERVRQWRAAGWPGTTAVTLALLQHWWDEDKVSRRQWPFYFCQLEAVETLIWHAEAAPEFRQGVHVPGDGGGFERLCNKMATGSGKTTVMAMIITWQVLNALIYPKSPRRYSSAIFLVAPGLTVKSRLQVLMPGHPQNYYDLFELCPSEALRQKLNRAAILIENWHTLMPLKEPERSVVKKGQESDEAFTRRVMGKLADYRDVVVINDEAHHAYRKPADIKVSRADAEALGIDLDEATRWIEGLDRIHKTRRIARCYDLSATPFAPTGRTNTEAGLFEWVVSDFGLNDAIEAGLVKTPRVVVRDDALPNAQTLRPKLYHLYREADVADDLNRKAEAHEPLPALVQQAYTLLGADWRAVAANWAAQGHLSPPVMLTVCNRTETAARVEHYFTQGHAQWAELHAPTRTLRVDSRVLEKAEIGETATANKDYEARLRDVVETARIDTQHKERWLAPGVKKEEVLRELVDTVGKPGQIGQDLQNVVSVAMLSEGWDAKTVTHIMGLRAFTSQLLCEQVIGRGLRRVAYDIDPDTGLYAPEYVNVFGVPLSVALQPGEGGEPPPPPKPSVQIKSLAERQVFEIKWPNILRVDQVVRPQLVVQWSKVPVLKIDPAQVALTADIAPALGGAADWSQIVTIDLEKLPEEFRLQRLVFKAAQKGFEKLQDQFKGQREYLLFQLVRLVEAFMASDKLEIPSLFHQDPLRQRILFSLHMDAIVGHLMAHVIEQNTLRLEAVFDGDRPVGSTRDMRPWYTTRVAEPTQRSQISHIVVDSGWEKYAANVVEKHPDVAAWAKNDHLGFHILYLWNGTKRKYVPDFLVRYTSGKTLVLEIKGEDSPQDQAKRRALDQWVQAVNAQRGFGTWAWDVVVGSAAGLQDVIAKHAGHVPARVARDDAVTES